MSRVTQEYARQVSRGLDIKPGTDEMAHCALGLTGEAGEVADLIKKAQYEGWPEVDSDKLFKECGDVLWYLTYIITKKGWTLEQVMTGNIFKLENRRGIERYDADAMIEAAHADRD